MKILVVGGTHGNERTGIRVVSQLRRMTLTGVDTLIANPLASRRNVRFIETDLNRSSGADPAKSYEERRAVRLRDILREYDLILEFHDTVSQTTCGILTAQNPSDMQLRVLNHFGFRRVVIMPCSGKSLSSQNSEKTVSFEISAREKFSTGYFVEKILSLATDLLSHDYGGIELYKHEGIRVTRSQLTRYGLDITAFADFRELTYQQMELLGLRGEVVPFLIGAYQDYDPDFAFNIAVVTGRNDSLYCPSTMEEPWKKQGLTSQKRRGIMSENQGEAARFIQAINECEEEKNAVLLRYAQTVQELKLELARVCGHRQVTHDWAWARCTAYGYTDLIASPFFANASRKEQQV